MLACYWKLLRTQVTGTLSHPHPAPRDHLYSGTSEELVWNMRLMCVQNKEHDRFTLAVTICPSAVASYLGMIKFWQ